MNNDKEQKELLKKTEKFVLKTFDDIFKSETFICSIYLLKYMNDKDEKYFNKFIAMFRKFTLQEQVEVLCNVRANLIEQGKLKEKEVERKKI